MTHTLGTMVLRDYFLCFSCKHNQVWYTETTYLGYLGADFLQTILCALQEWGLPRWTSRRSHRFCLGKRWSQETGWSQSQVHCIFRGMPRNVKTRLLWSRRLRSSEVFLMLPCKDVAKVQVPSWQACLVPHLIPHLPAKEGRDELSSPARKLWACQTAISTPGLNLDLLGPHAPPGMERQNQHPLTLRLKNLCHWNTISPGD